MFYELSSNYGFTTTKRDGSQQKWSQKVYKMKFFLFLNLIEGSFFVLRINEWYPYDSPFTQELTRFNGSPCLLHKSSWKSQQVFSKG